MRSGRAHRVCVAGPSGLGPYGHGPSTFSPYGHGPSALGPYGHGPRASPDPGSRLRGSTGTRGAEEDRGAGG